MITAMVAESIADFGFDRYCIDRRDERLIGPHGPIKLGNKAFQVLLQLIERRGRLVTKDELMSSVWDGTIVSEFSLTSAIKELRRALGDDARAPRFIQSVYGRGYRFLSQIEEMDTAARSSEWAAAVATAARRPTHDALPAGSNDTAAPTAAGVAQAADRTASRAGDRRFGARVRRLCSPLVAAAILASSLLAIVPGPQRVGDRTVVLATADTEAAADAAGDGGANPAKVSPFGRRK